MRSPAILGIVLFASSAYADSTVIQAPHQTQYRRNAWVLPGGGQPGYGVNRAGNLGFTQHGSAFSTGATGSLFHLEVTHPSRSVSHPPPALLKLAASAGKKPWSAYGGSNVRSGLEKIELAFRKTATGTEMSIPHLEVPWTPVPTTTVAPDTYQLKAVGGRNVQVRLIGGQYPGQVHTNITTEIGGTEHMWIVQ